MKSFVLSIKNYIKGNCVFLIVVARYNLTKLFIYFCLLIFIASLKGLFEIFTYFPRKY